MQVLETKVHETIWGGQRLMPYTSGGYKKIGHLYSVNCNTSESNTILNGEYKGKMLNEYFNHVKGKYGLERYDYFPLVIALVEADDNLSIQVHPDDETALVLDPEIGAGKNESWFFIDVPHSGKIYNGCLCTSMDELKHNIVLGNMDKVTDFLEVCKGDYVYIEAGTLHAMSAGSLVYEIEENAGCTYRFYDFDRLDAEGKKRPLQIPEAFYSIDLRKKSHIEHYGEAPIEEKRYITQYYEGIIHYRNESNTLQVFTLLEGMFNVKDLTIIKGMSIILEPQEELKFVKEPVNAMVAEPKSVWEES